MTLFNKSDVDTRYPFLKEIFSSGVFEAPYSKYAVLFYPESLFQAIGLELLTAQSRLNLGPVYYLGEFGLHGLSGRG